MTAQIIPFAEVRKHHEKISKGKWSDPWISAKTPEGVYVWFGRGGEFSHPDSARPWRELTSPKGKKVLVTETAQIIAVVKDGKSFDKADAIGQLEKVSGSKWEAFEEHELEKEPNDERCYISVILRRAA